MRRGNAGQVGPYRSINSGGVVSLSEIQQGAPFSLEALLIGGGGGAGISGAGAGGYFPISSVFVNINTPYTITVGAGGAANSIGNNTVFGPLIGFGGGKGVTTGYKGGGGGSGGGGYNGDNSVGYPGGDGISGQGNRGGFSYPNFTGSGGGGGAAAVGGDGPLQTGGNGGNGIQSSITGTATYYSGGGAGAGNNFTTATGGLGGGGAPPSVSGTGASGTANTGGGGAGSFSGTPGAGGSGVAVLKIPNTRRAVFSAGVTSTLITSVAGFNIYKVTATSTTSETVTFI